MSHQTKIQANTYLSGVDTIDFQAFVWDFYYSLWDIDSCLDIQEVYQLIFSSMELYKDFLGFCKMQNFSFIDWEMKRSLNIWIILLTFEQTFLQISDWVKNDISDILKIWGNKIVLLYANEEIPTTNITYFSGLINSVAHNISVNSSNEVLYCIWSFRWMFEVYSFESWLHIVDEVWNKVSPDYFSQQDRIHMLWVLKEHLSELELVNQVDYSVDESLRFLELRAEYVYDKKTKWKWTKEDVIRFKLWVWERLREARIMFRDAQQQDTRLPHLSVIESSESVSDWILSDSSAVEEKRSTFKIIHQ
jgi:hypothetical protein